MKITKDLQNRDLKILESFKKNAKIRLAFNPKDRNWKWVKEFFGVAHTIEPGDENKNVENINKDIDKFCDAIKEQLEKKHEQSRIPTAIPSSDSRIPEISITHTSGTEEIRAGDVYPDKRDLFQLRSDSVFNPKCAGQTATLTTFESHGCEQLITAQKIFDNIWYEKYRGQQLIAPPGSGKTYVLGSVIANLIEKGFLHDCMSPWPVLYVTRASIVDQTKEDLEKEFGLDIYGTVQVINIEALRSSLVGTLIQEETVVINGEPEIRFIWPNYYKPKLTIYDESQALMRPDSLQSKVANARYENEDKDMWETYEVDSSATPWSRLMEAKHFALSTRKEITLEGLDIPQVTPENWPIVSREITGAYTIETKDGTKSVTPADYCPDAIRDFVNIFEDRIIWIKDVRPKHKGYLKLLPIEFDDPVLYKEYLDAEETYYKKKAKIEASESMTEQQKGFSILASYTIFTKAAENCRRYFLAKWINDTWNQGYAPAIGFRFKQTATNIIKILFDDYNWTRNDISIIWGGATETLNQKKKIANKIKKSKEAQELLEELDIDLEDDMGIYLSDVIEKTAEQLEWERKNDLHLQKPEDRDREKKRYLRQDTKVAMFSYKAGGVGLSLHHQSKYPKARPRRGMFTPDYSEKLGIQALGRLPRLTSESDTYMWFCYYRKSIETEVMRKFLLKCQSLKEVTRSEECWTDLDFSDMNALSMVDISGAELI